MVSKATQKRIALERVEILFKEASSIFSEDRKLAHRYVKRARKIAMGVNARIPTKLKRRYCKHCYSYLKHGQNVRVRSRDGTVIYTCGECGKHMRFPVLKERKSSSL